MKTERAMSEGKNPQPYPGIYWKSWTTKDGEQKRQLYVAYKAAGKLRWERIPSNGLKDAVRRRTALMAEVDKGEFIEPARARTTVATLAERWLSTLRCKPQTLEKYRISLRRNILPDLGQRTLRSLTAEDIERLVTSLRETLSAGYTRQTVALLKRVLRAGVRWGYLKTNPVDTATPEFGKHRRPEIQPLTPEEARRFLDHLREHKPAWYPFFLTAVSTGMRIGELLAMKWENVDWDGATYHVRQNLTRSRTFDETKTPESEAKVPLSPAVLAALKEQRARLEMRRWRRPDLREDLVFLNICGKPYVYHNIVFQVFKPALAAAGVRDIRFHDLRHTCASLMLANGESIKAVQRQLRHANPQITLATYAHLYPEDQAAAAARLDAVLVG